MNWINNLLQKPAAKPVAPPSPKRSAKRPPADDTGKLRRALVAAVNDVELQQAGSALGRALAELLQTPQPDDPPGVWVAAVCHVPDKDLALAWTAGLAGDLWLGEVATHAGFSETRLAAARRIEDSAVLEHIAQISRDKDKRVYRHCFELLRQRRQADEDRHRAVELAAELRGLLNIAPLHLSRLLDLEKELCTLGEEARAECNALLDQAHTRLQQESLVQRDLQVRKAAAQLLLEECADVESTEPAQLDDWRVRFETLADAQVGLPTWLSSQAPSRKLDELLRDIEGRLAALRAERERILACEQFIDTLASSAPVDAESGAVAAAAWAALSKPENPATRQSLESRWRTRQTPPASAPEPAEPVEPTKPTPPPIRIDLASVRPLLEKFERDVEQGHLADAEAALKALGGVLGDNSLHGEMESRLQRASAQLGKLRGWARWSTEQARDNLIAAAEQLLVGEPGVDDLAQGVQELREKWKQLNSFGVTAKGQWERFDAALEKAYQPVAARHAEEVARQGAAREIKVALCVEWESYFTSIIWEHVDFKALEVQRQEMLRRWRAADQAGFRDERMLRKRLDKLINSIDQRIEAMRTSEVERREQLIAEAEALRESSDLGRAITVTKSLQERWNQPAGSLRLNRGDEQKLWKRFRAACAEVFARRDAQRAEQVTQREEQTKAIRALLDDFATTLAGAEANSIKQALGRFRADWKAAKANSREISDGLEARAQNLQQQAQQRMKALLDEKRHAHFELLAKKAALAESVEAASVALVPSEAVIAAAKQAWDGLPSLPGKTESLIAERFARASDTTAKALACGRKAREILLLDLEIALGLPSPEASSDARRKRQLERLQKRFGADSRQTPEAEALLVDWYATAAEPDVALDQRMVAVKHKLLELTDKNNS